MTEAEKKATRRAYRLANLAKLRQQARRRRRANPEKYRDRDRQARIKYGEQRKSYFRRWKRQNPKKILEYSRRHKQLPTPTREVPAACECCGSPKKKRAFALDHCHVTGKFRGWLCVNCNTAIGKLGDNLEGLQRALAYLTFSS